MHSLRAKGTDLKNVLKFLFKFPVRLLKRTLGAELRACVSGFAGKSSTTCVRPGGVSHGGLIHVFAEWSCKMAARWGTGEEMITAYKTEYFSPMTLDEVRLFVLLRLQVYSEL